MTRTRAEKEAAWLEEERADYEKWWVRALRFAEELEHRIGDIGEFAYPGHGFHYAKQARIRKILAYLAEPLPNVYRDALAESVVRKVILEVLAVEVANAEKYIVENRDELSKLVPAVGFADWVSVKRDAALARLQNRHEQREG